MFSIVIVSWNNDEQLNNLIKSISRNSFYDSHEIICVFNEREFAPNVPKHVKTLSFDTNVGLSLAANTGAKLATQQYICLIDDDMEVCLNWDSGLFHNPMFNWGLTEWVSSTMIEPIPGLTSFKHKSDITNKFFHQNSNTPLLMRKTFWDKIGGYDIDFPSIGAELGLAKRAYDAGERWFLQTPFSRVIHHQSISMDKLKKGEIKKQRENRDFKFKEKYGITKKEFVRLIKKGQRCDPII